MAEHYTIKLWRQSGIVQESESMSEKAAKQQFAIYRRNSQVKKAALRKHIVITTAIKRFKRRRA